jgi:uncharacterized protein YlaI
MGSILKGGTVNRGYRNESKPLPAKQAREMHCIALSAFSPTGMKIICILCDKPFQPDKLTEKKIHKYPHRIQICPSCKERIKNQVLERQRRKQNQEPHSFCREVTQPSND